MTDLPSPEDAPEEPTPDVIVADLEQVIGGAFTVDAIGPERHDAVVARLRANPEAFLAAFENRYLGANFDPLLQSRLHSTRLFDLLEGAGADQRVRATADSLLRHLQGALAILDQVQDRDALEAAVPEETANTLVRLDDRRRVLNVLVERLEGSQ